MKQVLNTKVDLNRSIIGLRLQKGMIKTCYAVPNRKALVTKNSNILPSAVVIKTALGESIV